MTRRPESHRTDRQGLLEFKRSVPEEWIVREKDQDYGIDLEVEIFEDDKPTGLLFYVQSKGTRSAKAERRVRILRDRLEYLLAFDVPSIISRPCLSTGRIHWMWAFDAARQVVDPRAEKVGLKFAPSDLWSERTPQELAEVLKRLRRLRSASRSTPVDVVFDLMEFPTLGRFAVASDLDNLVDLSQSLRRGSRGIEAEDAVTVLVAATTSELTVSIEPFAMRKVPLDGTERTNVAAAAVYALASLLADGGLTDQARLLASLALEQGWLASR